MAAMKPKLCEKNYYKVAQLHWINITFSCKIKFDL